MNSTGDFLQFRRDIGQIRRDLGQSLLEAIEFVGHACDGSAKFQAQADQSLLRPVVQIAFKPATSLIGSRDNPRPRSDQVCTGCAGGDRCGYQVGEFGDALLGVQRKALRPCRTDDGKAPEAAIDDDRAPATELSPSSRRRAPTEPGVSS